jgi:hypothetical protein
MQSVAVPNDPASRIVLWGLTGTAGKSELRRVNPDETVAWATPADQAYGDWTNISVQGDRVTLDPRSGTILRAEFAK